jgi:hypothetical protein
MTGSMNEPTKFRRPIFGSLSILLPTFGAGVWMIFEKYPHLGDGLNGYAGMFIYLVLILVSGALVFAGVGCGIAGLIRRERWRLLAVIGLLFNLAIILRFKH